MVGVLTTAGINIFSNDSSFSDANDNFNNSCGVDGLYSVVNNFRSNFNSEDDAGSGSIGDSEIRFDDGSYNSSDGDDGEGGRRI